MHQIGINLLKSKYAYIELYCIINTILYFTYYNLLLIYIFHLSFIFYINIFSYLILSNYYI